MYFLFGALQKVVPKQIAAASAKVSGGSKLGHAARGLKFAGHY